MTFVRYYFPQVIEFFTYCSNAYPLDFGNHNDLNKFILSRSKLPAGRQTNSLPESLSFSTINNCYICDLMDSRNSKHISKASKGISESPRLSRIKINRQDVALQNSGH